MNNAVNNNLAKRKSKLRRAAEYVILQAGATGIYRLMGGKGKVPSMLLPYGIGAAASRRKASKNAKKGG